MTEKYQVIFNAINDAIIVHDTDTGRILDVNQKMCEMFGYTAEEARGIDIQTISAGVEPYAQADAVRWIKKASEIGPQVFEWRCRRRNGVLFWAEVNLKLLRFEGRDRTIAVLRDIDERKRSEELYQKQLRELQVFYKASRGRERRVLELKKKVDQLESELKEYRHGEKP